MTESEPAGGDQPGRLESPGESQGENSQTTDLDAGKDSQLRGENIGPQRRRRFLGVRTGVLNFADLDELARVPPVIDHPEAKDKS